MSNEGMKEGDGVSLNEDQINEIQEALSSPYFDLRRLELRLQSAMDNFKQELSHRGPLDTSEEKLTELVTKAVQETGSSGQRYRAEQHLIKAWEETKSDLNQIANLENRNQINPTLVDKIKGIFGRPADASQNELDAGIEIFKEAVKERINTIQYLHERLRPNIEIPQTLRNLNTVIEPYREKQAVWQHPAEDETRNIFANVEKTIYAEVERCNKVKNPSPLDEACSQRAQENLKQFNALNQLLTSALEDIGKYRQSLEDVLIMDKKSVTAPDEKLSPLVANPNVADYLEHELAITLDQLGGDLEGDRQISVALDELGQEAERLYQKADEGNLSKEEKETFISIAETFRQAQEQFRKDMDALNDVIVSLNGKVEEIEFTVQELELPALGHVTVDEQLLQSDNHAKAGTLDASASDASDNLAVAPQKLDQKKSSHLKHGPTKQVQLSKSQQLLKYGEEIKDTFKKYHPNRHLGDGQIKALAKDFFTTKKQNPETVLLGFLKNKLPKHPWKEPSQNEQKTAKNTGNNSLQHNAIVSSTRRKQ